MANHRGRQSQRKAWVCTLQSTTDLLSSEPLPRQLGMSDLALHAWASDHYCTAGRAEEASRMLRQAFCRKWRLPRTWISVGSAGGPRILLEQHVANCGLQQL